MGGASSEVSASTRHVLLEAATFEPRSVRRTSRRLGLVSEASYRFERGVDAEGIPRAAERAAAMLAALGGGAVCEHAVDRYPEPVAERRVSVALGHLRRVAGRPVGAAEATGALRRVLPAVALDGEGERAALVATIPSWRPDLGLPEDLVEEILRLGEGYTSPARPELVLSCAVSRPNPEAPSDRARDRLAAAGLCEIVTWGFLPRARLAALSADGRDRALVDGIVVSNPISADYEVMRTSLVPGLAEAAARNLARGVPDVLLFEVGPIIRRPPGAAAEPVELEAAGGILVGRAAGWLKPGEPLDFFDVKAVVEELLRGFGAEATFAAPAAVPYLHPGLSADIRLSAAGGPPASIGHVGELHPVVARRLGLEARAHVFEVFLAPLVEARADLRTTSPPRFPAVSRDVSFWIAAGVSADAQRDAFLAAGEPLLRELRVLEDFRDPKYAPAGKKGMLWSMLYRADDRTLTDAEADAAHGRVVGALRARHDVTIR
jgi:phenylalanyl-tRNA synthetase beta chain